MSSLLLTLSIWKTQHLRPHCWFTAALPTVERLFLSAVAACCRGYSSQSPTAFNSQFSVDEFNSVCTHSPGRGCLRSEDIKNAPFEPRCDAIKSYFDISLCHWIKSLQYVFPSLLFASVGNKQREKKVTDTEREREDLPHHCISPPRGSVQGKF